MQRVMAAEAEATREARAKVRMEITHHNCLPGSRNHQGRRGTTADIGDNLLPSLTVLGCSPTAVEVQAGPLFDVVFPSFLLLFSLFLFPGTAPL